MWTAEAIRDGGTWRPTSVMFTPMFSLVQAPGATLISHNYLGCAGVGNANLGGGATPPLPPGNPNSGSIFGGKSMRLRRVPPTDH